MSGNRNLVLYYPERKHAVGTLSLSVKSKTHIQAHLVFADTYSPY